MPYINFIHTIILPDTIRKIMLIFFGYIWYIVIHELSHLIQWAELTSGYILSKFNDDKMLNIAEKC